MSALDKKIVDIRDFITYREDNDIRRALSVVYNLLGDYIFDNKDTAWGKNKSFDDRITLSDTLLDDDTIKAINNTPNDRLSIDDEFECNNEFLSQVCSFLAYYISYDGYSQSRAKGLENIDMKAFVNTMGRLLC